VSQKTIFSEMIIFEKWIRSHRDLPFLANQWTNIIRLEFKTPTLFIRA